MLSADFYVLELFATILVLAKVKTLLFEIIEFSVTKQPAITWSTVHITNGGRSFWGFVLIWQLIISL